MAQTKQQKEVIALIVLLVIAAMAWYFYFGTRKTGSGILSASGKYEPIDAVDYSNILKVMDTARATEYKPSGRNIFIAGPVPAQPTPGGPAPAQVKPTYVPYGPQLPPEPPPPVLRGKLFGLGAVPANGPRRAFLQDGEDVQIVGEGDTVQNTIRITHIGNDRIEYEDINTGKKNSSALELPPAA